jgi:SAM-dependent methyltransferase
LLSDKSRACPACREPKSDALGRVADFDICSCDRCKTLFTSRLPLANELADYYASFYGEGRDIAVPAFVLDQLRAMVRSLSCYRTAGRWLDIGCGRGSLLRVAAAEGWEAVGTEIVPAIVDSMRAQGLDARLGLTQELDLPSGGFDVVSAVEVLEHVPDPGVLMAEAARLVRPGGAVYITTPHGRGISRRLLGTGWSVVAPPEHLQLLSSAGIRSALSRPGLRTVSLATTGVNPYELATKIRPRRRAGLVDSNRVCESYQLNQTLSTRRVGAAVKRGANTVLSAMRLGDTLKVLAERPAGRRPSALRSTGDGPRPAQRAELDQR